MYGRPILQDMTLKLLQRMFAARTALTTREAYLSLAEPLVASAQAAEGGVAGTGERGVVTLAVGLDPADEHCIQMLKRVSTYTNIIACALCTFE